MFFGDVIQLFSDEEVKEYVYLGTSPDGVVFLAAVPSIQDSQSILKLRERRSISPSSQVNSRRQNHELFFIVELTTEEFKNRIAYLGHTDYDDVELKKVIRTVGTLNNDDLESIKKSILEGNDRSVNPRLKKIAEGLN